MSAQIHEPGEGIRTIDIGGSVHDSEGRWHDDR